jgi:hypothetical protein
VTRKQRKYVRLALGKNPLWIWFGVGFRCCNFLVYSSNLGSFGRVPYNTTRPLLKTSFESEWREIISYV